MYMTVRVRSVEQMFTVVISKGQSLWESWADVRGGGTNVLESLVR